MRLRKSSGKVLDIRMDEGSGTVAGDSSRYGNDGALNGCKWVENGLEFNGSSDYVDCGNDASLKFESSTQDFSIFTWIKRNVTGISYIFEMRDGDNDGWSFRIVGDAIWVQLNNIDVKSSTTITDNLWHNVGAVIDRDDNGQIYIDGIADGSPVAMGSQAMSITSNGFIGVQFNTTGYFFNGSIDQVRIYNRVLTAREMQKQYESTKHKYE